MAFRRNSMISKEVPVRATRKVTFSLAVVALVLMVLFTLVNCGGGGGGGGSAAAPSNNVPRFAYVANYNDNTVSIYR